MLVHVQSTNVFTMFARTAEDRVKWMEAIKEALDNVLPRISSPHEVSRMKHQISPKKIIPGIPGYP